MKILVVCQHYYPESFRITDICEELVKRGHEVTVLTGLPNYPRGEIYPGYKCKDKRKEFVNGVKIYRCFTIGRKGGIIKRILNYYSFSLSSTRFAAKMKEEFDVVFINQLSPVMMARAGIKYAKKHGKKTLLYCLDLWPESLIAGGIKRKSIIYKLYRKVSEKIYKKADCILITSKSFARYFIEQFDISENIIKYLPQYSETWFVPEKCKKEKDGKIDLMFAGNIGIAQSIKTIIYAAELTKDIKNLYWHIVGDGTEADSCKKLAKKLQLENIIFYGKKPLDEMPDYYKKADAMLITLINDPFISRTIPGKLQTYMAAAKPLIGAIGGETSDILKEADCGYCSGPEDPVELAKNVRVFCESYNSDVYGYFSDKALKYYSTNFTKDVFFEKLERIIKENA